MTWFEFVAEVERQMDLESIPVNVELKRVDLTEVDLCSHNFRVERFTIGIRIVG